MCIFVECRVHWIGTFLGRRSLAWSDADRFSENYFTLILWFRNYNVLRWNLVSMNQKRFTASNIAHANCIGLEARSW